MLSPFENSTLRESQRVDKLVFFHCTSFFFVFQYDKIEVHKYKYFKQIKITYLNIGYLKFNRPCTHFVHITNPTMNIRKSKDKCKSYYTFSYNFDQLVLLLVELEGMLNLHNFFVEICDFFLKKT